MITHLRGWKILQKDQARRLKYQEGQRFKKEELSKGQLKSFVSKLIKRGVKI